MILKLMGEVDLIDYIDFVHHLDNAMKQTVLDSRRSAMSEKLRIAKAAKVANVRNQWDLVYEPPDPQPIFTDDLVDSHQYARALNLVPPSNLRSPPKYRTDDRNWSKVAVITRIGSLNTGVDSALDMSAVKFPKKEERFNPAPPAPKDKKGTESGGAAQARALKELDSTEAERPTMSPRQMKTILYNYEGTNGNFSPYTKGSTHHPRPKAYSEVGVPVPEPLFTSATHMKYDYTARLNVPKLDLSTTSAPTTRVVKKKFNWRLICPVYSVYATSAKVKACSTP